MSVLWPNAMPTGWFSLAMASLLGSWKTHGWKRLRKRTVTTKRLEQDGESIRPHRACRTEPARSRIAQLAYHAWHWSRCSFTGGNAFSWSRLAAAGNPAVGAVRAL